MENSDTSLVVFTNEFQSFWSIFQGRLLEPFQLVCQQSSQSWTRTVASHPNCHSVPKARGKFTEDFYLFFPFHREVQRMKALCSTLNMTLAQDSYIWPSQLHHLKTPIAWQKKGSWADFPSHQFLQDSRWGLTMSTRPTSPRLFT